jgi:hypothetical protein
MIVQQSFLIGAPKFGRQVVTDEFVFGADEPNLQGRQFRQQGFQFPPGIASFCFARDRMD